MNAAVTRFAPSPTGWLHAGNAYSALLSQHWARTNHARLLLRIEDIDRTRCRNTYTTGIREDLAWLGFSADAEMPLQSTRHVAYQQALHRLQQLNVVYPCFCSRRDFQRQQIVAGESWHCPANCEKLNSQQRQQRIQQPHAWRLQRHAAISMAGSLQWWDAMECYEVETPDHDPVIGRKDIIYSYHLAVVVDDGEQGVTHIIRGKDLQAYTPIHRLLQSLLGYAAPYYYHHPLLTDAQGERLAKQRASTAIRHWREQGMQPDEARQCLNDIGGSIHLPSMPLHLSCHAS